MKIKLILTILLFLCVQSFANKIYVNENFIKQKSCQNIEEVTVKSISSSKDELFDILKNKSAKLGGNSIIHAEYSTGFFGAKSDATAILAKCDIQNTRNFFLRTTTQVESSEYFGTASIFYDKINLLKTKRDYLDSEEKANVGVGAKFGLNKTNFRTYIDLSLGTGLLGLLSIDYKYNLNANINLFAGLSYGVSKLDINDIYSLQSPVYGVQLGLRYNQFEVNIQKLIFQDTVLYDEVLYEVDDAMLISLAYHF